MDHLWLPLTLASAVTLAASDALTKKALVRHNEYLVIWLRIALALPMLLPILLLEPIPSLGPGFHRAFFISLALEVIATFLFMKALKLSPLSLTLPFLSLTPVFLLVIPFLLLGEQITGAGAAGIVFIAVGSYALNIGRAKEGFFAPLRAIRNEPGVLGMIGVALIYSFTSTLGKQAITSSAPLFFAVTYYAALVAVLAPVALYKGRNELHVKALAPMLRVMLVPAALNAIMVVTHMLAMNMTNVAYMISVKRTSLLFGVLFGHFLLKERGIRERLTGAAIMVTGAALILLGQ
jgi:drug/metabolite transporter (DMT)-like permease